MSKCSKCRGEGHNARTCDALEKLARSQAAPAVPAPVWQDEPPPVLRPPVRPPPPAPALVARPMLSRIRRPHGRRRQGLAGLAVLADGLRFAHLMIERLRRQ